MESYTLEHRAATGNTLPFSPSPRPKLSAPRNAPSGPVRPVTAEQGPSCPLTLPLLPGHGPAALDTVTVARLGHIRAQQ